MSLKESLMTWFKSSGSPSTNNTVAIILYACASDINNQNCLSFGNKILV